MEFLGHELTLDLILKLIASVGSVLLSYGVLTSSPWYLCIMDVGIFAIMFYVFWAHPKEKILDPLGKTHLWAIFARHDDGQEHGAPMLSSVPAHKYSSETFTTFTGEEFYHYWLEVAPGEFWAVVLDPRIKDESHSPLRDLLKSSELGLEFRNIGMFRAYVSKKISEVGGVKAAYQKLREEGLYRPKTGIGQKKSDKKDTTLGASNPDSYDYVYDE